MTDTDAPPICPVCKQPLPPEDVAEDWETCTPCWERMEAEAKGVTS